MSQPQENDLSSLKFIINGREVDPQTLSSTQQVISIETGKNKGRRTSLRGCSCLGCGLVLLTIVPIVFGLVMAASAIFGFNVPFMNQIMTALTGVEAPQTQALTTDPNRFDPFVGLAQAQALAGADAQLVSIMALYVRSDGTMDLNASYSPAPRVDYEFLRPIPRPADAPPVGVAGSTNGQWYEPITIEVYRPGTRRRVSITSGGSRVTYDYVNEGMVRDADAPTSSSFDTPVETPQCTAQELWRSALEQDAPRDAVAIIDYDEDGYRFSISGEVNLNFTLDCELQS